MRARFTYNQLLYITDVPFPILIIVGVYQHCTNNRHVLAFSILVSFHHWQHTELFIKTEYVVIFDFLLHLQSRKEHIGDLP